MHTEMKRRGELLRVSEAKFEDLVRERDKSHEYAATWKRRAEAAENEVESLRATLMEATKKAEEKEGEMGRVLGDVSHTREALRAEEEGTKKLEVEVVAVRAELVQAEKSKEAEDVDVEMGGVGPRKNGSSRIDPTLTIYSIYICEDM